MTHRVKSWLVALAIHAGIAIAATWPTVTAPLTRMIGHADGDVWNHAWGPWWFWQSLGTGELPWHTTWLNAPWGGVLWFIDPSFVDWDRMAYHPLEMFLDGLKVGST